MHSARETLTPHDIKNILCPPSPIADTEETHRASILSTYSQGFNLQANASVSQPLQLNSNMNDKRNSEELQYTPLHLLTPKLELMKVKQSQQQLHAFRTAQSDPPCSFAQQHWSIFKQALITQFAEKNEYLIEQQSDQRKQQLNESVSKYYYDIIDLCKKYHPHISGKQEIRKLTNGLKLSLYQAAIKERYSTPYDFLTTAQQLENIQKLIELIPDQTTQVSNIMNNNNKLSSPHHRSNNYTAKPMYYPSSVQHDYLYEQFESNQNQQYPTSQSFQSQQMYNQPHGSTYQKNYSSEKLETYCYNCGQSEHIARYCQQYTASQYWIRKYAVDICQSTKLIVIHRSRSSTTIRMDSNMGKHSFDLKLVNTIILEPQHEAIVRLKSPISSFSNVVFHSNHNLQYKKLIDIPNAVLSIKNYETYDTIPNSANKICRIPIHTNIGQFTTQPSDIRCYTINSCLANDRSFLNKQQ
ncbi:unnamed protein product [Rotaria socialis]|uniref:CCHC-type domain-containing protein n=1 Tax=Rotaria socialis TaxID=392032 RepID=A0A820KTS2_9BILA|nr:unnamed protein product [Rotaria socialis]CAF4365262.1 unnamed protein product [Rotaria socialis]CAF4706025.1 unnamed protein product [Rotaria socialis]